MRDRGPDNKHAWRPPTRRMFVAMLGAAAAALVVKQQQPVEPPSPVKTRWIGHC